jgi:hypothetical protein
MPRKIIIGVEQEPRVQFSFYLEKSEDLPDMITLPDGSVVVLHGRYASPGDRYSYRRIRVTASVTNVAPWEEHTGLVGN